MVGLPGGRWWLVAGVASEIPGDSGIQGVISDGRCFQLVCACFFGSVLWGEHPTTVFW